MPFSGDPRPKLKRLQFPNSCEPIQVRRCTEYVTFYVLNLFRGEGRQAGRAEPFGKAEVANPVLHYLGIITILAVYWMGIPTKLEQK
jgi:hypothetical protein